MSWKFVPNDDFDLDQLNNWKQFFEKDLKSAKEYLREVQVMGRRLRLPNIEWMENAAKADIRVSKENLGKINEAIRIAEGKPKEKKDKKWVWF